MYKFIAILCLAATVSASHIESHHVVHEPVLAKVGSIVHSAPSAVSHQSITQVHSKPVVHPILAPVVKTTVHAVQPIVQHHHQHHVEPIVHHQHIAPLVHHQTYEAAPIVAHSVPVLHHSAPLVSYHSIHH